MRGDQIQDVIGPRLARILEMAEAALPSPQAEAFKRSVKRELGTKGLVADLLTWMDRSATGLERNGTGRK